jgi:hypothetical protein
LEAGPLTLEIQVSKTAHLFHVVDQISQWSEFCHRQYARYFEALDGGLNAADRDRLAQHTTLRKAHGWGGGLEQTLYTAVDLETALAQGVQAGWLTESEAQTERGVLKHFQPRIERLLSEERPVLDAFREQLSAQQTNLAAFAQTLSRFVGGAKITVPVYLMANPDDTMIGGGYNGERLTLEVPRKRDAYPSLLHELFHAFFRTRQNDLEHVAGTASGLNAETLSEGLAYAYNPGIIRATDRDPLLDTVAGYLAQGASLSDAYTRFNTYGLALRPLLKDALADPRQTLETFLPRTIDAWLVLTEIDKARGVKSDLQTHDYCKDPRHSIFLFGLWDEEANRGLTESAQRHIFGRRHFAAEYQKMLTENGKAGDTIILLLSLDDAEGRVPAAYWDLLPMPWAEVERRLKQGQVVFERGKAREMNVFLLAVPTTPELRNEFRRLSTEKRFSP